MNPEFDTLAVPTRTHGDLEVWREVEGNLLSVFCARGYTAAGNTRLGFGTTIDAAVNSVLHDLAAQDAQDGSGRGHNEMGRFPTHAGSSRVVTQTPVLPELPEAFFRALGRSQKIMAIKEARNATGWQLIDAKRFTDSVFNAYEKIRSADVANRKLGDEQRAAEFRAESAPRGTVIRINGKSGGPLRAGWLLEKSERNTWHTTALLTTFTDDEVQESVDLLGCVILEAGA